MKNVSNENESAQLGIADVGKRLSFYQQPFHLPKYGNWVYDFNSNFVFQFESEFDKSGKSKSTKLQEQVLKSLNSNKHIPIPELKLTVHKDDPNWILNHGSLFLIIRGWGNLTGKGAHNLSNEKASKIQDDFRDWIIYKLSV